MFDKREVTVKLRKKEDDPETPKKTDKSFDEKADKVLELVESVGIKVFAGICVYIILDTHRQVAIEKARHQSF